jgi:hypothetical protein
MGGISDKHLNSILPAPSVEIIPAGGLFVRYGLNTRYSLRGGINAAFGALKNKKIGIGSGVDSIISFNPFAGEVFGLFEFNFHPLNPLKPRTNISPYIAFGLSYLYDNETYISALRDSSSVIHLEPNQFHRYDYWVRNITIPFNVGIRYLLSPNLTLGVEWALRWSKLENWTDFRNVPGISSIPSRWRSFIGVTIGYSFVLWETVRVPFY